MKRDLLSIAVAVIVLMTIAACATGKVPEQKADPKSALFKAIQANDLVKVKEALAAGADPNAVNGLGANPLWIAEVMNNIEIAKALIEAGADINKPVMDTEKDTLLIVACRDHQADFAKFLIESGADVNIRNDRGAAPLHPAVCKDLREVVELLIAKGADLNVRGSGPKDTPLEKAKRMKHTEIAEMLAKAGA